MGVAYPLWWNHRSEAGGQALLKQATSREGLTKDVATPGATDPGGSCHATPRKPGSGPELPGILEIPAIGVEAPVLQGLGDNVLNVAVGHAPGSVWPGTQGTSIFEAHDVSYFSNLGAVHAGEKVAWIDDCQEIVFKVDSTEVTQPGAVIPTPRGGVGVALITCYPSNALFWTPNRLMVVAHLVSVQSTTAPPSPAKAIPLGMRLPVPPGLAAEGLSLAQNNILVGHLQVAGTPDRAWDESADPLAAARLAFDDLAAARLTAQAGDTSWWAAIALPGVAMPDYVSVVYPYDCTVDVQGSNVRSITLSSADQTVSFVVRHGVLYVAGVSA